MKPVYETERRSNNRWLLSTVLLVVGIVGSFIAFRAVIAQVVIEAPKPVPAKALLAPGEIPLEAGIAPVAAAPPVVKWEYKTIEFPEDRNLAAAGREGWELVAVTPKTSDTISRAYFKRPLRDAAAAPVFSPDGPAPRVPPTLRGRPSPRPIDSDEPFKLK